MTRLEVADIVPDVEEVLRGAKKGKGDGPRMLTAYQVLHLLPPPLRARLIVERGIPGKGAGQHSSAASLIAHALVRVGCIECDYLDTRGLRFMVGEDEVEGGYELAKLYRYDGP
ncbi:MAG: hypothetical protein GXP55_22670 [Deltaproteobacteria bacterium]|nr:hypothetical protein [Deltaproteobacteria bacterium]